MRCVALLACLCCWLSSGLALADNTADEADLAFRLGAARYQAGEYEGALQQFLLSNRLASNRNVKYNIARVFERLSRFPDAYRWYLDAREGEARADVLRDIDEALGRIRSNVALLAVRTEPEGATLYVNRRDLGAVATAPRDVALVPGEYRILASLPGYEPAESLPVQAAAGTVTPIELRLVRIVGRVRIDSDPDTEVRLERPDAEVECVAPCELTLPPGSHLLHFRREGFRVLPQQVRVVAGEQATLRAESMPLTGSIVVTADEREALIEVDGQPVGFTPAVVPEVAVGERRVRVSLRGYEPVERAVQVREGQQADLRGLSLLPTREVTAASRLPENIEDAPTSVSMISPQELEAFHYPTIYEALRGTRGVSLSFDSTYSSVSIRGLGQPNDYGNRVLILSDGATLNDNLLFQSFTGFDGRVDLGDVERIEVVRGPGSVLYGTGAVSGVVNLVTRPRDAPSSVSAELGTFDRVGRARVAGQYRASEDTGVWLSASAARSDGRDIVLPVLTDGVETPTDIRGADAFEAASVAGRAWHKDLTLQWFGALRDIDIPTGAFGTRLNDPGTAWIDGRALAEARYEPHLTDEVQLLTRAFFNLYRFDGDYSYDGEEEGTVEPTEETYAGRWFGAEARVVARLGRKLRLSAGGELQISDQASLAGNAGGESYLDEDRPYQTGAGYALVEWQPAAWLRASAGARVDWFSTFGVSVNPRLAVILRPSADDNIKIMGGRAFRAPSIYELLYNDGGITQLRADFDGTELGPETVISGEMEYTRRLGRDWSALASAHIQWADDIIETVLVDPEDPDAVIAYRNSDEAVFAVGGDVEVRREWRSGWMLAATYGYLLTQYADRPDAAATESKRLPNAPRHFASARGVVPLGSTGTSLAVRGTLEAPRRIGLESDASTDPSLVMDLVLSGESREYGLKWAAGVYNLFDWQYQVPVTETFASRRMPQAGRQLLLSVGLAMQ